MRRPLALLTFAAVLGLACRGEADVADPKTLYTVETTATTSDVKLGEAGKLVLAIKLKPDAEMKAETPFKTKLTATPGVTLSKQELAFKDARLENKAPVFEVPFEAVAAGPQQLTADMTFFVCTKEACLRTTEKLQVPVTVK